MAAGNGMTCAVPSCTNPAPDGLAFCDDCWGNLDSRHRHQVRKARKVCQRFLSRRSLSAYEQAVATAARSVRTAVGA